MRTALVLAVFTLLVSAAPARAADVLYWAEVTPKEVVADVTGWKDAELEQLGKLAEKYMGGWSEETHYAPVPADEALVPKRFPLGGVYTIVTTAGSAQKKLVGYGVAMGASETHLFLRFEPVPGASGQALVVPPTGKVAAGAKLRPVVPAKLGVPPVKTLLARVRTQLLEKAPKEAADEVKRLRLAKGTTTWVEGAFGAAIGFVAIEAKPRRAPETDNWGNVVSAAAFVDAKGAVVVWAQDPGVRLEGIRPLYLVDLEGDGQDELVASFHYYEGDSTLFVRLVGKTIENVVLTGDGA